MKKTLVSALTAALVVGAASTTFAAANPFSDVPSDSWAYDAVSQLAADGVIEGYGDGTFRGQQNITRYEMAQMVAKAMAKSNVSAADKALIDKLAAEFSDELNNLGVRVSNLERNADQVKWTGEARYRYWSNRQEDRGDKDGKSKNNTDQLQLRLFPTAEVNDHWHVKARLTATTYMDSDNGHNNSDNVKLTYVFAEGNYGKFDTKLGKMPLYSVADDGLVVDDFFSGAQVNYGTKLKATLEAGRMDISRANDYRLTKDAFAAYKGTEEDHTDSANYQGIELNYNNSKWDLGAAYRHFNSDAFRTPDYDKAATHYKDGKDSTDDANIWSVGSRYTFDHNWKLFGAYAQNTEADNYDKGWNTVLSYKGAQTENAGTWGLSAAYRYVGQNVGIAPTYDTYIPNTKGWDFMASYTPFHNTLLNAGYFTGKQLENSQDAEMLYGRVSFFF